MIREGAQTRRELTAHALRRLANAEAMYWRVEAAKLVPLYASNDPEFAESLLSQLAEDEVPLVREAAAVGLASLLESLEAMARTPLLARWALSDRPRQRAAAARALCSDVYVIGAPTAVGVLARDSYAVVREAATCAAALRVGRAPALYLPVLRERLHDNRRSIRCAALDGIQRAAQLGVIDVGDDLINVIEDDETSTALCALTTLDSLAYRDAEQALQAFERLAEQADDLDEEIVDHLVASLTTIAADPERRERALRTIARRSHSYLSSGASEAVTALG